MHGETIKLVLTNYLKLLPTRENTDTTAPPYVYTILIS